MNMADEAISYEIEHITRFRFSEPVREAVVTVYLQPRTDHTQHLDWFRLETDPGAELSEFEDCFGNSAHFFDIPGGHDEMTVTARSLVDRHPHEAPKPAEPSWDDLETLHTSRFWHLLNPTELTQPTPALEEFVKKNGIEKSDTPLASIRELTARIHEGLSFRRGATRVDSPIDDALTSGSGVCQDFTHIMLAIVRGWGVPARYTSGYLFPREDENERQMAEAGHAWVECRLPGTGWFGADPTNNTVSPKHHIRVAVGRDYRDVPPTRGTFRGVASQELDVTVRIAAADIETQGTRAGAGMGVRG